MIEAWTLIENGRVVKAHDADRIVPWWSFTKTVLAAAALALVRDGRVALDEPVEPEPERAETVLDERPRRP